MELTQIRYFLEVASTQHMTRSAERLHIAQPALTQAIRRLERDLGVPLFAARGRGIVLTEYGRFLQERLTPLMQELDEIPSLLQTMAQLEEATIHLNVLAASALVTEAIIAYRKTHPDLHFKLSQHDDGHLYDIGITTRLFYQPPETASKHIHVCTEQIYLAVPHGHPFAARAGISLDEAADEGFISLMGSRQLRHICDRYCREAGFAPKIIFESDSPAAVQNMIAANMGVGFWPEFTWGAVDPLRVALVPITVPLCRRDLILDCRHNKTDSAAVDGFFAFLKEYFMPNAKPQIFPTTSH